jgi:hypothetical protein
MICPTCHGRGLVIGHDRCLGGFLDGDVMFQFEIVEPCRTCGGCGYCHCCDGEQAQPEIRGEHAH